MTSHYSSSEIEAFLDEALDADKMAAIESSLREDKELLGQVAEVISRRDAGIHSLGEIWRRHRVSCPSREDLGSYLLEVLPGPQQLYLRFHLETVGCRMCQANLEDLQLQQAGGDQGRQARRKRYFESSAGYLRRDD